MHLGDDEGGADRTDAQPEKQESFVALCQTDAHHGERTETEQPGVGAPRSEAIAERSDQQARHDRHTDGCDIEIGDLIPAQVQIRPDHRHQRGDREPGEEADEERHPCQMKDAHRQDRRVEQIDTGCFVVHATCDCNPHANDSRFMKSTTWMRHAVRSGVGAVQDAGSMRDPGAVLRHLDPLAPALRNRDKMHWLSTGSLTQTACTDLGVSILDDFGTGRLVMNSFDLAIIGAMAIVGAGFLVLTVLTL